MNAKLALSSLVFAAFAGNALAESPVYANDAFSGAKTVAEVRAELDAFKRSGVNPTSTWYNPLKSFRSATTREAVTAQYLAARDEVRALSGEDSGSAWLAQSRQRGVPPGTLAGTPVNAQ